MDLSPSEDQQAIIDLADRITGDHCANERLRTLDRSGTAHDAELWRAMVDADLIGLALPESSGGGGYGLTEAVLIAEVVGRHAALVPFGEVIACARALARGNDPLAAEVATGAIVVPALREGVDGRERVETATVATDAGDTWTLQGDKRFINSAAVASHFLVSAMADGEVDLFVVDAAAVPGTDSITLSGQVLRSIHLDGTPARRVDLVDGLGAVVALVHELRILRCAQLAGISGGAVRLAAEHCKQREQFGAPIGTFQAVGHRMADAWLDADLIRSTARQAAWRTDHELPSVQAAASAAMWACEGSQRVVHAAQHVHGGIGMDLDYPVHRYFHQAKELEVQLGGASACTRDLGATIAAEPLTIG